MNFVKPLHLFEVHIFESTKKNAFSIINSEPTSTVRRKIYADRYEISGGGLTFFQSAKNAADELVEVPVISFPQGKWESVNLIRNKMIIAEHRTGASTGASHVSIQSELKKSKNVSTNTFKIIQMPANNIETHKEMDGITKLMEQVNILLEKHQDVIDKISKMPAPAAPLAKNPEGKISNKFTEETVSEPVKESPPAVVAAKVVEPTPEPKSYSKEIIQEHVENANEEKSLWDDINSIENTSDSIGDIEPESTVIAPSYPSDEPVVHDISSETSFDDFNIDIDEITAALDSGNDTVGQEAEPVDLNEKVSLTAPAPRKEEKPTPVVKKQEAPPPPAPAPAQHDDDILGLLETLSPSLMNEMQHKEVKAKKREFVSNCLNNYIKATDMFKFEYFVEYLSTEKDFSSYNITSNDVEWEIAQLILAKQLSPRKFIKEKLQKHISLLLPGIMKKYWDGNIIPILDIAKTHNEISEMNLIDLAVWMSHNGYK